MQISKIIAKLLLVIILLSLPTVSVFAKKTNGSDIASDKIKFRMEVVPNSIECTAGEIVRCDIKVLTVKYDSYGDITYPGELVFLRIEDAPSDWISKITPSYGRTDFKSKLTLKISTKSQVGTYKVKIVGISFGGHSSYADLSINVISAASKTAPGFTYIPEVDLYITALKNIYHIGERIEIIGSLSNTLGSPISHAAIYILVINPDGRVIHFNHLETEKLGTFYSFFYIERDVAKILNGTYVIYATAWYGSKMTRTHTTFILEYPSYPSVQVDSIIILNSEGEEVKSIFHPGESMKIRVSVTNYGMPLDSSIVWIEIQSPNGVPLKVLLGAVPLESGDRRDIVLDFKVPLKTEPGVYLVKVLVSDKPISMGGMFIAIENENFIVEY